MTTNVRERRSALIDGIRHLFRVVVESWISVDRAGTFDRKLHENATWLDPTCIKASFE